MAKKSVGARERTASEIVLLLSFSPSNRMNIYTAKVLSLTTLCLLHEQQLKCTLTKSLVDPKVSGQLPKNTRTGQVVGVDGPASQEERFRK
jgi:hypothetical protein